MIQYVDLQHCRFTLETGNDFSSAENIGVGGTDADFPFSSIKISAMVPFPFIFAFIISSIFNPSENYYF